MGVGVGALPRDDNGVAVLGLWNDATGKPIPAHVGATVTGADGNTYGKLGVDVEVSIAPTANQRVNAQAGDITDLTTLPASLTELLTDTDNLATIVTNTNKIPASPATEGGNLASIKSDLDEIALDTDALSHLNADLSTLATSANQSTGNTSLSSIKTDLDTILTNTNRVGASVALTSPPVNTNAGSDTVLTFASKVNHWLIQNNTNANAYIMLDAVSSTAGVVLVPGAIWRDDIPVTSPHVFTAAAQPINAANGIIFEGWL